MKKKVLLSSMVIVISALVLLWAVFSVRRPDCSTLDGRQQYLNELADLRNVNIDTEIRIDDSIISGYTAANGRYGLAVFAPAEGGAYQFQSNDNTDGSDILISTVVIHGAVYDLFWPNSASSGPVRVTYSTPDGVEEYQFDFTEPEIFYMQAPDQAYEVSAAFAAESEQKP
jgi:hypothetical protein